MDSVADKNLTPLHMAVSTGSKACVEILVAANANVNSENDRGQTPLHDVLMKQSMTTDGDTPDTFVTQSAAAPQIDQVSLILQYRLYNKHLDTMSRECVDALSFLTMGNVCCFNPCSFSVLVFNGHVSERGLE